MRAPVRFQCPSAFLTLKSLLRRARRTLCVGLGLAVFVHAALTQLSVLPQERRAVKPLTTHFVKRQPRLTKPLELKKRPRPTRRQMQRRTVSVKARASTERPGTIHAIAPLRSMARPRVGVRRSLDFSAQAFEPMAVAQMVESQKKVKRAVDMSLEMVDVEALDTGQFQAMVIQDPRDKRNVRGFFHMAYAYSVTMYNEDWHGMFWRRRIALMDLIEAVNRYTSIQADMTGTVTFDQQELLSVPWVFAGSFFNFRLTQSEAQNLGKYMMIGGFLFADAGRQEGLRLMIGDALATQRQHKGKDWNFDRLPNSHPIYHCFFDFPGGPPVAGDFAPHKYTRCPGAPFNYLEGVTIDGRLLAIMSMKWFAQGWSMAEMRQYGQNPVPPQQFGVNVIVFALTQEGSITARLMDSVAY